MEEDRRQNTGEKGEEREWQVGFPKWQEGRKNMDKLHNIAQHFAIKTGEAGANQN